jgi:hypothetical protein
LKRPTGRSNRARLIPVKWSTSLTKTLRHYAGIGGWMATAHIVWFGVVVELAIKK